MLIYLRMVQANGFQEGLTKGIFLKKHKKCDINIFDVRQSLILIKTSRYNLLKIILGIFPGPAVFLCCLDLF